MATAADHNRIILLYIIGSILNWYEDHQRCWIHGDYWDIHIHGPKSITLRMMWGGPILHISPFLPKGQSFGMCRKCSDEACRLSMGPRRFMI